MFVLLEKPKFWLLGIASSLIILHLTITWKVGYSNLFSVSILLWVFICHSIWQKHQSLNLKAGVFASILGAAVITILLVANGVALHKLPYISPVLSAFGLALIASGFKGLKQYKQEIFILAFPAIANLSLSFLFNLSELTAKLATFMLWYIGFTVHRVGIEITVNTATVEVNQGCSGQESILQLLVLSVLFLAMFPRRGWKKFFVPAIAGCIGFIVNSLRVALMAILVAHSKKAAFEYWHKGDGSLIFSLISVLIFCLYCLLLLRLEDRTFNKNSNPI